MTNDGFAAQLRQHLLESADERPADGQLAAIVDRIASTAQRRLLGARLTWFPGRVGPFPSTAVRYGLIAALVGATIVGLVLVAGSEAPPTPDPLPSVIPPAKIGECVDVPAGGTYRADIDALTLTVTIPTDAATSWEGQGGGFSLMGFCSDIMSNSGPFIGASIVTYVDGSCEIGDTIEVTTPSEVIAALAGVRGVDMSEPSSVELGGHAATRFEILPNARMCFDAIPLWNGFEVARGTTIIAVVDVDGWPLAITITDIGGADGAPGIAEAEAILASLQIDVVPGAQPSRGPVPTPDANCLQVDGSGTYTAPVGPLSVTATVSDDHATYWSGPRGWFLLRRSPCGFDAPLTFETQLVTKVAVDACRGLGDSVAVRSAAEAATALADQASTDLTGRTDITIDGHPAVRVRITVPSDLDTSFCDEGAALLLGQTVEDPFIRIDAGWTYTVYLVDFDGSILAITALHETGESAEDPAVRGEIDAIIGSLHLRALDGGS